MIVPLERVRFESSVGNGRNPTVTDWYKPIMVGFWPLSSGTSSYRAIQSLLVYTTRYRVIRILVSYWTDMYRLYRAVYHGTLNLGLMILIICRSLRNISKKNLCSSVRWIFEDSKYLIIACSWTSLNTAKQFSFWKQKQVINVSGWVQIFESNRESWIVVLYMEFSLSLL